MTSTAISRGCSASPIFFRSSARNSSGTMVRGNSLHPFNALLTTPYGRVSNPPLLSVDVRQDIIDGPGDGHQIGDRPPHGHERKNLHVGEVRSTDPHPVGRAQAVTNNVIGLFPPGGFRRSIRLSPGHLGTPGDMDKVVD